MDKKFREYHQYTDDEFKQLWRDCLFVFDTNTLLNMYRYSRKTVDAYIKVLKELKKKDQLWLPYHVGYEFYENRIDVIREYEKSYDEILLILEKAKNDINAKYKNHPFLDLQEIKGDLDKGLSATETKVKRAKSKHPNWLERDDVLADLNGLFEGCIGDCYDLGRLQKIKEEGQKRYDKKIPPGYKDNKKPEDKKFGDLILWFQIIDHAAATKKPIIFITGDVKEDWWLERDGHRLMPEPQLKRELLEKAQVEFHIYTADRFLDLYESGEKRDSGHTDAVKEVRKIRELEEKRRIAKRIEDLDIENMFDSELVGKHYVANSYVFELLQRGMDILRDRELRGPYIEQLEYRFRKIKSLRNGGVHGYYDEGTAVDLFRHLNAILNLLETLLATETLEHSTIFEIRSVVSRLTAFIQAYKVSHK